MKKRGKVYIRNLEAEDNIEYGSGYALRVSDGTLAYTDTSATDIATIPANANIAFITLDIDTAFNDSSNSDVAYVGNGSTTNAYLDGISTTATGMAAALTDMAGAGDVGTSSVTVKAQYYGGGGVTSATAGSASVSVVWYKD